MFDDLDLSKISDEPTRQLIVRLLNLLATVSADLRAAQAEHQRLRDAINRRTGDQGPPPTTPHAPPADHSSAQERRRPTERVKRGNRDRVQIDRAHGLTVEPALLPPAAVFTGYAEVVVQAVIVHTDTVCFRTEKVASATTGRPYLAELPTGYAGTFGPGVRARALVFYFAGQMTEPKILAWFRQVGIQISAGQLANLLITDHAPLQQEHAASSAAGLRSSPWHHRDATATRVDGQHQPGQVMDHPRHPTSRTLPSKDRLSVIDGLRTGQPRRLRYTDAALAWLEAVGVSAVTRRKLAHLPRDQDVDAVTLNALLDAHLPGLGLQTRTWVLDALAVAADQAQTTWPMVRLLMCDGALQCTWVTADLALCWVHAGRQYQKLLPAVPLHHQLLDTFLADVWDCDAEVLAYRQPPTATERARLSAVFDRLFAPTTGSWALNERMALTRAKQAHLLMVLTHPELPLQNNPAELGARRRVRKRAISCGPRTRAGTRAWDTFMSLAATAQQVGVNFYQDLHDRIAGANQIPQLS